MIKYLGSVGTFIRLNDNDNKTYQLLNIYSSSAANLLLFSAQINNFTGLITFDSASTSLYINGESGSVIPSQQWTHITFSFDDRLATYDINNFLIRVGDAASSNFNIQNFYYMQNNLSASTVKYIHQEFTGESTQKLVIEDNITSINIIDKQEDNFISSNTGDIYHSIGGQKRFTYDIAVVSDNSLQQFTSSSFMTGDFTYIDGYRLQIDDKVLSLADNQIYQLTASSQLITISSSVGDFVNCFFGQQNAGNRYLYTASGFNITPFAKKVSMVVNYGQ